MIGKICTSGLNLLMQLREALPRMSTSFIGTQTHSAFVRSDSSISRIITQGPITIATQHTSELQMARCVRDNIKRMGISDIEVIPRGVGHGDDGSLIETADLLNNPTPLSEVCSRFFNLSTRASEALSHDHPALHLMHIIRIYQDNELIGHVNSDRRFSFTAASDLREAIAWSLVTDVDPRSWERIDPVVAERILKAVDLALKCAPPHTAPAALKDYYEMIWLPLLKLYTQDKTLFGRYNDTLLNVAQEWWKIGFLHIRGIEHPGFDL